MHGCLFLSILVVVRHRRRRHTIQNQFITGQRPSFIYSSNVIPLFDECNKNNNSDEDDDHITKTTNGNSSGKRNAKRFGTIDSKFQHCDDAGVDGK